MTDYERRLLQRQQEMIANQRNGRTTATAAAGLAAAANIAAQQRRPQAQPLSTDPRDRAVSTPVRPPVGLPPPPQPKTPNVPKIPTTGALQTGNIVIKGSNGGGSGKKKKGVFG